MKLALKYALYRFESYLYFPIFYFEYKNSVKSLKRVVAGKKIIIIGSGPSAKNVELPKDSNTLIACCNFSTKFLPKDLQASLYMTTSYAVEEMPSLVSECIQDKEYQWIGANKINFLKKHTNHLHAVRPRNVFMFSSLISLNPIFKNRTTLMKKGHYYFFSTGVQMTLLCLLAEAKEVYIAGIDIDPTVTYANNTRYETDPLVKINKHQLADSHAMQELANKNIPVYSLVESSPLSKILKHKTIK